MNSRGSNKFLPIQLRYHSRCSIVSGFSNERYSLITIHHSLKRAVNRLRLLLFQDAIVLPKNSLGDPKLQHVLRTSRCSDHPLLSQIDETLQSAITQICNVTLSKDQ
jgi:hypothetical protein